MRSATGPGARIPYTSCSSATSLISMPTTASVSTRISTGAAGSGRNIAAPDRGADRRGRPGRALDQLVRQLLRGQPGKLGAQHGLVADRQPGGHREHLGGQPAAARGGAAPAGLAGPAAAADQPGRRGLESPPAGRAGVLGQLPGQPGDLPGQRFVGRHHGHRRHGHRHSGWPRFGWPRFGWPRYGWPRYGWPCCGRLRFGHRCVAGLLRPAAPDPARYLHALPLPPSGRPTRRPARPAQATQRDNGGMPDADPRPPSVPPGGVPAHPGPGPGQRPVGGHLLRPGGQPARRVAARPTRVDPELVTGGAGCPGNWPVISASGTSAGPPAGRAAGPGRRAGRRRAVRGAAAPGPAAALRPALRDRRGAGQLGRAQGADAGPGRAAHRGARRGPSHRVPRLRGRDPARRVRRRRRDRLGPGHLGAARHR